jgi:hypothetical protein
MQYPLTFYVDSLPPGIGGCANGPVIRILKKYKGDRGLLCHELEHVKQWWITTILAAIIIGAICYRTGHSYIYMALSVSVFQVLYSVIPWFKLQMEVEAYRQQMKHYADDRVPLFAKFIATKYDLKITAEEAEQLLRNP